MTEPYCEPRDVFALGLSARAFVTSPRPLDGRAGDFLDFASGTFWLQGHGIESGDLLWLVLIARGGTNALPGGGSETVPLYGLPLDFRRFQVSTSKGGTPLTFTDAGSSLANGTSAWGVLIDPLRRLEALILAESADCDQCLIAHRTPIERDPKTGLYPQKLVDITARGTARRAIAGGIFDNAQTKVPQERLEATAEQDKATKAAWARGVPLYPTPVDQTGKPDNAGQAASRTEGRAASSSVIYWVTGRI